MYKGVSNVASINAVQTYTKLVSRQIRETLSSLKVICKSSKDQPVNIFWLLIQKWPQIEVLPTQSEPGGLSAATPLNSSGLSAPNTHSCALDLHLAEVLFRSAARSATDSVPLSLALQHKLFHNSILSHNKPVCIPELTGDSCIALVAGRGPGIVWKPIWQQGVGLVWGATRDLECVPTRGRTAWMGQGQRRNTIKEP